MLHFEVFIMIPNIGFGVGHFVKVIKCYIFLGYKKPTFVGLFALDKIFSKNVDWSWKKYLKKKIM